MAQEFTEADRSPTFRSNGTAEPDDDDYRELVANAFADYRLVVDGLVAQPASYSLAELRALRPDLDLAQLSHERPFVQFGYHVFRRHNGLEINRQGVALAESERC